MKTFPFILSIVLLVLATNICAQDSSSNTKKPTLFDKFSNADTSTKPSVKIHQDKRIEQIVTAKRASASNHATSVGNGFRVQVFSSNTQRTAKSEAYKIEKELKEAFPTQNVYVNYTSPFWKVRVGDFKTLHDAQVFRAELIDSFPNLRSATYTVKDQINLQENKN